MKAFIDNKIIRQIHDNECPEHFLKELKKEEILFGWPSFFTYLGYSSPFENLPKYDEKNELYSLMMEALNSDDAKEVINRLYEQIFANFITEISSLREINPEVLLENIREKKKQNPLFLPVLYYYETIFEENAQAALHDLTLYLAWDRICVSTAIIIEQSLANIKVRHNLHFLKECLLESFQHITEQGKTVPSFFRLIETFYAEHMREDYLQVHSDEEWLILCQGAQCLKSREELPDVYYVDLAIDIHNQPSTIKKDLFTVYVSDSKERVETTLSLTKLIISKIKSEFPSWPYFLYPVAISWLK